MIETLLTTEFLSMIGGSLTGFIFKYMTEQREIRREQFEMLIEKNKIESDNQDRAVARIGIEAGKIVRRTIVLCVFNISVCTSKLPVTVRFVNVGDIVLVQALPLPTII